MLINPDGSGRTTLPTPGGFHPVWSADGRWLAYSTFPEPWVIRVVRAGGAGATLATWYVPNLDRVVDELVARGVTFDRYDDPVLRTNEKGSMR